MRNLRSTLAAYSLAACLVAAFLAPPALAQAATRDAAGHWEGLMTGLTGPQEIALDVARQPDGTFRATISGEQFRDLPVDSLAQDGDSVRFALALQGGVNFRGALDAKGEVLSGVVSTAQGESAALSLTRNGEARFAPPPSPSARVEPRLEGVWDGVIEAEGRKLRIELKLANGAAGADGVMTSLDEGLVLPVGVDAHGAKLKLDIRMIGGSYNAELTPAGDALNGVFDNGRGFTTALMLKRR